MGDWDNVMFHILPAPTGTHIYLLDAPTGNADADALHLEDEVLAHRAECGVPPEDRSDSVAPGLPHPSLLARSTLHGFTWNPVTQTFARTTP